MCKVSIIIPTFNRSNIIKKTIDSILKQTFQDYEILVVSNGSTDDTESVVKCYQDLRIQFFSQEGSGSPASPRNHGIMKARGEYIAFCDDDDIWIETKLEKQMEYLLNNPKCGVCCTKMKYFSKEGEWVNPDSEEKKLINRTSLLYKNTIPLSSVIIGKSLLNHIGGFDESKEIAGAEDYELMLRLSNVTNIFCIPEYLILYYFGENRFSNATSRNYFNRNIKYFLRLFYVYRMVVEKGYFKWREVLKPLIINSTKILKIILYESKVRILK